MKWISAHIYRLKNIYQHIRIYTIYIYITYIYIYVCVCVCVKLRGYAGVADMTIHVLVCYNWPQYIESLRDGQQDVEFT